MMKIIYLILGIILTLTGESHSYDPDDPQYPSIPQKAPLKNPNSKIKSSKIPDWVWADGALLSPSELLYLEAEIENSISDWHWADKKPLTEGENSVIPGQLKFPNWMNKEGSIIPPKKLKAPAPKEKFSLTADHVTHDAKRGIVWAWGKVIMRLQDSVIKADKVKVKNKSGDGKALGNVLIIKNDGTRLSGQKTLFNINNQQGRMFQTRGRLGKIHYIKGKEITRYSNTHYKIKKGHLTSCRGSLPDWLFEAESMDLVIGDRALLKKATFKVRGIPLLYVPIGYFPINQERKTGFLRPGYGNSEIDGWMMNNTFFWAINRHSDATFTLGYRSKRGFSPGIEYRYTPSQTTKGLIIGTFIDDKITGSTFWRLQASHEQILPNKFEFKGILDIESEEFNRNFVNSTLQRTRRNSDSHATISKRWRTSSLDIIARYRDSSSQSSDQTYAELPNITYKTQRNSISKTDFFFNQDTNFASFQTDLDTSLSSDDKFYVQRFDFHPQLSYLMRIAPWLTLTPTIGLRETLYSKGLDTTNNNERLDFFSRESFDIIAQLEGPKIAKIFHTENKSIPKIKHLIEPRINYNFIPDIDREDRKKIKVFDGIDSINRRSSLSYFLTQRLLQKEVGKEDSSSTREILRFDISQSFDLIEATGSEKPENKRPFSDIRFDLDSRLHDYLELNVDSTFDIYLNTFKTWNFEIGLKPLDSLYLSVERRYVRRGDVFTIASIDWDFKKGWKLQASSRLDEITDTHRENHLSLLYDDPCKCWGFNFDMIKRNNFVSGGTGIGTGVNETKYFLGITLRGLGTIKSGGQKDIDLHRKFKSIYEN